MSWIAESKLPNKMRKRKNISFKSDLDSEIMDFLEGQGRLGVKAKFINDAVGFYYRFLKYRKGAMIKIIEENFDLAKYLVRQIGRVKAEEERKIKEQKKCNQPVKTQLN